MADVHNFENLFGIGPPRLSALAGLRQSASQMGASEVVRTHALKRADAMAGMTAWPVCEGGPLRKDVLVRDAARGGNGVS